MLSIGQMANLCQTSVQTLRLYDRTGVLPAAKHDSQTGYRFYNSSQIFQFQVIKYLQQSNLTLAQINQLLSQTDPKLINFWSQQVTTAQERVTAAQRELQLVTFQAQQVKVIHTLAEHADQASYLRQVDQLVAELPLTAPVTPLEFPDTKIASLNHFLLQMGELPNLEYSFSFAKHHYSDLTAIHYRTAFKTLISAPVTKSPLIIRPQRGTYLCVAFHWSHAAYLAHYRALCQAAEARYPTAPGPIFERSFPLSYDQVGTGDHFIAELSLQVSD